MSKNRIKKKLVVVIVLTTLILISLLLLPITRNKIKIKELSLKLKKLESSDLKIKNTLHSSSQKNLKAKIEFLKNVEKKKEKEIEILSFIEKSVAKAKIDIVKLEIEKEVIVIEGFATNSKKALQFLNYFKENQKFKEATIGKIYNKDSGVFLKILLKTE